MIKTFRFLSFFGFLYFLSTLTGNAQHKVLLIQTQYTAGDTAKLLVPEHRGDIKWQKSTDQSQWFDIPGEASDSLLYIVDTSRYIRAIITEGTCQPLFSDTIYIAILPVVSTYSVTNITQITATCGGNVTGNGAAQVIARGVCWSSNTNPTVSDSYTNDGFGTGTFSSQMTGLFPNVTYFVRAYATTNAGTVYGDEQNFITAFGTSGLPCPGTTTTNDFDGNIYNTVLIGNQCWLK